MIVVVEEKRSGCGICSAARGCGEMAVRRCRALKMERKRRC